MVSSLGSGQVGQYSQAFARGLAPPCLLGDAAEAWRREKERKEGEAGRAEAMFQAAQLTSSASPAAILKELKTPALKPVLPSRGCPRSRPGTPCPTWPSGSLQSLGATCSLSPAPLSLLQVLEMCSFHPWVSNS